MCKTALTGSKFIYLPFQHPQKQFSPPFTPPFFHGQIDFDYSSGSTNYGKVVHSDNPENWELSDLSSFNDQDYCLKISLFLNL